MLLEIHIQGILSGREYTAKKELQNIFSKLGGILEEIPIKITITPNFDQVVDAILKERSKVEIRYSSKRNVVTAQAKTICYLVNNGIAFVVVFDSNIFGGWGKEQYLDRFVLFSHEMTHITDYLNLFHFLGTESLFLEPTKRREWMFHLAHDIWMDYNAERSTIEILEEILKGVEPEATISYASHDSYVRSFIELLKALPGVLNKETSDFRKGITDIDDLWSQVYLGLREMLIVASFTTAHSDALSKGNGQIEEMKNDEEHYLFFQIWESIHEELRLLYGSENKFDIDILTRIADKLVSIFGIYGFVISDKGNGMYLYVPPSGEHFCY